MHRIAAALVLFSSAAAFAGYAGATYFFLVGTGTSRPASFASTALSSGAVGEGEGA